MTDGKWYLKQFEEFEEFKETPDAMRHIDLEGSPPRDPFRTANWNCEP
jgi:hypothetical protein